MSFIWDVQLPSMWVSQAAPAGTKGFRAFGEQQQPQLHMGDVQVDLLLVSQLSHGGMLRTLLASAALCRDMVPGQALWFPQGCHLPWDPFPYLCHHVAALTVPLINEAGRYFGHLSSLSAEGNK